jgi:hypothetical protein
MEHVQNGWSGVPQRGPSRCGPPARAQPRRSPGFGVGKDTPSRRATVLGSAATRALPMARMPIAMGSAMVAVRRWVQVGNDDPRHAPC